MRAMAGISSLSRSTALWVLLMCVVAHHVEVEAKKLPIASVRPYQFAPPASVNDESRVLQSGGGDTFVLNYHNGPLLTGVTGTSSGKLIPIYLIWYGTFSSAQQSIVKDFFASFEKSSKDGVNAPSVSSWWKITSGYKDRSRVPVAASLRVVGELTLAVEKGKTLSDDDIETLLVKSLQKLPTTEGAVYVVLTAKEVLLDSFCMDSCASHFVSTKSRTKGKQLLYIWVGNPGSQCPGFCAWPYAKPQYGPPDFKPLRPPSGDVGMDGLIINLASILAGIATNPFNTGYYQGEADYHLEAATACTGIFGDGSYAGYPGQLLTDKSTHASYNAYGFNKREFLLPAMWNPKTQLCSPPLLQNVQISPSTDGLATH